MKINIVFLLFGLLVNCQVFADTKNLFSSQTFSFEYPTDWLDKKSQFPTVQAAVGPKGESSECSVNVKEVPGNVSQADLDAYLLQKPDSADYETTFKLQYNDVKVIQTGNSTLGKLPAQVVRVRYSVGSSKDKVYVHSLIFSTATLHNSFTLTCGSTGSSQLVADEIFNKWLMTFNKLIATFRIFQ